MPMDDVKIRIRTSYRFFAQENIDLFISLQTVATIVRSFLPAASTDRFIEVSYLLAFVFWTASIYKFFFNHKVEKKDECNNR